jgi:hypothetical protein
LVTNGIPRSVASKTSAACTPKNTLSPEEKLLADVLFSPLLTVSSLLAVSSLVTSTISRLPPDTEICAQYGVGGVDVMFSTGMVVSVEATFALNFVGCASSLMLWASIVAVLIANCV